MTADTLSFNDFDLTETLSLYLDPHLVLVLLDYQSLCLDAVKSAHNNTKKATKLDILVDHVSSCYNNESIQQ